MARTGKKNIMRIGRYALIIGLLIGITPSFGSAQEMGLVLRRVMGACRANISRVQPLSERLGTWEPVRFSSSQAHQPIYADPTLDTTFKQLMWQKDSDPVALSFINTFVPDLQVQSLEFIESAPLAIPALRHRGKKQTFMDFHVRAKDGHRYIVEMQSKRHVLFDERALFYACSVYSRQIDEKDFSDEGWYKLLKPVIAIQIVDYDSNRARGLTVGKDDGELVDDTLVQRVKNNPLPPERAEKYYRMTDRYSGQTINYLDMIQIELPRYKVDPLPKTGSISTDKDWWVRILKNVINYTEDQCKLVQKQAPSFVVEALNRLKMSKWSPRLVQEYNEDIIRKENYTTYLQIEREEGVAEEQSRIIKNAIANGFSDSDIEKITGVPVDKIAKFRSKQT